MGLSTASQAPATTASCGVSTRFQGRHCCDIYRALPREILPLLKKRRKRSWKHTYVGKYERVYAPYSKQFVPRNRTKQRCCRPLSVVLFSFLLFACVYDHAFPPCISALECAAASERNNFELEREIHLDSLLKKGSNQSLWISISSYVRFLTVFFPPPLQLLNNSGDY